jgi:hypothetical protein
MGEHLSYKQDNKVRFLGWLLSLIPKRPRGQVVGLVLVDSSSTRDPHMQKENMRTFEEIESAYERMERTWQYRLKRKLGLVGYQRYTAHRKLKRIFSGWGFKMMSQRVRKGYCTEDVWSLDCHIAEVLSGALHELADISHGWPGEESPWPTFEQWQAYVHDVADRMGAWGKDFCDDNAFKKTQQAMREFAEHFGMWWD